ncbi:MAG: gliding motility protein GldN [Paludibacteraceae bacterium]|nr:gliding motility protein GldN [Paludibacteraceae bacterium]
MIKKLSILACLVLGALTIKAQHNVTSFFDEMGMANIRTDEYSQAHDTIVMVNHRIDDVIWSRVVYRIIDMRYRQNYQLYFPVNQDDENYSNLFKVIIEAVVDGMDVYPVTMSEKSIKPDFQNGPYSRVQVPKDVFRIETFEEKNRSHADDETYDDISQSNAMLVNYDSINDIMKPNYFSFQSVVKNQVKYMIQEIVFFDKHTSRLHTKIMAIAPLHPDKITQNDSTKVMEALHESIVCWIPFDELRPYLAMQYIIPNRNETKRVTYDEFFQKRLFTSYIVGEGNMYNRMIPDYEKSYEGIKKEQERIATELLNFEQDLWEY